MESFSGSYLSLKNDDFALFRVIFQTKGKNHAIFSKKLWKMPILKNKYPPPQIVNFQAKANVLVRDTASFFDFHISAPTTAGNNFLRILKFPTDNIVTKIVAGFICALSNEEDCKCNWDMFFLYPLNLVILSFFRLDWFFVSFVRRIVVLRF